ncbi:hypothetical protein CA13_08400 [Planctomycetes bacterium CA13]|uniref:Sialate O-acetylesterase domain-containing protein n=2 Tax=Novipirellula herctigrandis TaxID=2527986 RepID=A0A5C5YWJ1_9BACT|nr:hypothetical protein CA13_08400 [Planctomycetes bacterium CA13]
MKNAMFSIGLVLIVPLFAIGAEEAKLAQVFSDHMVLQREKPIPVWGWGGKGDHVNVEFAEQKKGTTVDTHGKWMVELDPLPANAEPSELVVTFPDGAAVTIHDVLVGEVWLGSGQSNMQMTVSAAKDFETEQAAAALPLIRMFKEVSKAEKEPNLDASGEWLVCSPKTVGSFSATLFFFGRELHRELNVPVGLINSSVGGTPIESWIAAESQRQHPQLRSTLEPTRAVAPTEEQLKANYAKALQNWEKRLAKAKAEGKKAPKKPKDPLVTLARKGKAGQLFNGKISPLVPYAVRGALWYQGEANSHPGKGFAYQYQLPLLVSDWRARWGDEFPFAWVQLPNYNRPGEDWSLVQEAMLRTLRLPKTGMAITVDIGEPTNIHPKNKQEVGRRLSLWALGDVYGNEVEATSGPLPTGHQIRGSNVILSFSHTNGGLKAKGGDLKGFEIVGEDNKWVAADARIEGSKVSVSSPSVAKPIAVRYAWAPNPDCNLYNGAGLPASPFRTKE